MGKEFSSDPKIEKGRVYEVTRLLTDCTPSDYETLVSQYSDDQLNAQIRQDAIADDRNFRPHIPRFRK